MTKTPPCNFSSGTGRLRTKLLRACCPEATNPGPERRDRGTRSTRGDGNDKRYLWRCDRGERCTHILAGATTDGHRCKRDGARDETDARRRSLLVPRGRVFRTGDYRAAASGTGRPPPCVRAQGGRARRRRVRCASSIAGRGRATRRAGTSRPDLNRTTTTT